MDRLRAYGTNIIDAPFKLLPHGYIRRSTANTEGPVALAPFITDLADGGSAPDRINGGVQAKLSTKKVEATTSLIANVEATDPGSPSSEQRAQIGCTLFKEALTLFEPQPMVGHLLKPSGGQIGFRRTIGLEPTYHKRWFRLDVKSQLLLYWETEADMQADCKSTVRGEYELDGLLASESSADKVRLYFFEPRLVAKRNLSVLELRAPSAENAKLWAKAIQDASPLWEGLLDLSFAKLSLLRSAERQGQAIGRDEEPSHEEDAELELENHPPPFTEVTLKMIHRCYDVDEDGDLNHAEFGQLMADIFKMRRYNLLHKVKASIDRKPPTELRVKQAARSLIGGLSGANRAVGELNATEANRHQRDLAAALRQRELLLRGTQTEQCRRDLLTAGSGDRGSAPSDWVDVSVFESAALSILFSAPEEQGLALGFGISDLASALGIDLGPMVASSDKLSLSQHGEESLQNSCRRKTSNANSAVSTMLRQNSFGALIAPRTATAVVRRRSVGGIVSASTALSALDPRATAIATKVAVR